MTCCFERMDRRYL